MKPLFSVKFTIFLFVILFVPFLLTNNTKGRKKLEPYPAIILPSGAGKIDLNQGIIKARSLSLYGYDTQGILQKIDVKDFLKPIPKQYFYSIAMNDFGLSTKKEKFWIKVFGRTKAVEVNRRIRSREEQEIMKNWLSNKLTNLGLSDSSILIRYEQREIDTNNGKEILNKVTNEKTILLR